MNNQQQQRFTRLCKHISVVLESKFPKDEKVENFLKKGVNPESVLYSYNREPGLEEKQGQIWHSGKVCQQNGKEIISFKIITNGKELYRKLIFRINKCLATVARLSETCTFGFENSRNLPLAFPGVSGDFEPIFVKIRPWNKGEVDEYFVQIFAEEFKDPSVVPILLQEATKDEIPKALSEHSFD